MRTRAELQTLLEKIGVQKVYYQPPKNIKLKFPCIIYKRERIENKFENDNTYILDKAYKLTLIDEDPDSEFIDKIANLPTCRFQRHYTADGMNHDVFIIYF